MDQDIEKQTLFTHITVALNNIEGVQKTYNSIQNQTLKNYEWLVIDGNSSDSTKEWLKTAPANWISEVDKGIYDAMNKGIERASGEYLLFLNAGDTLATSETLEKITQKLSKNKPDFIYGDAYEGNHYKRAKSHKHIARGMVTNHQAMLYRRKNIKKRNANKFSSASKEEDSAPFIGLAGETIIWDL